MRTLKRLSLAVATALVLAQAPAVMAAQGDITSQLAAAPGGLDLDRIRAQQPPQPVQDRRRREPRYRDPDR